MKEVSKYLFALKGKRDWQLKGRSDPPRPYDERGRGGKGLERRSPRQNKVQNFYQWGKWGGGRLYSLPVWVQLLRSPS